MRIAIVDDRAEDAAAVKRICEEWAGERGTGLELRCFDSGEALLDAFAPDAFELVFLDIYMGGMNGLETARRLREKDRGVLLVFLTTSPDHMAEAFPCHAFDYVEKPAAPERIGRVLEDALALLPEAERFIELPGAHGGERLALSNLVSAESAGNYIVLCAADGSARRCRMTFTELQRLLSGDRRFLSTIRGVILNMDYIDDLREGRCVMKTGAVFPVKVRDSAEIEAVLNRYRFDSLRTRQERGRP